MTDKWRNLTSPPIPQPEEYEIEIDGYRLRAFQSDSDSSNDLRWKFEVVAPGDNWVAGGTSTDLERCKRIALVIMRMHQGRIVSDVL